MAQMLHATGVAKNKREAAELAGIAPQTMYQMSTQSEPTQRLHNEVTAMIEDDAVATSKIIELLGRKALGKIAHLMETGKEETQLRAAQDLADRAPDTQRVQQIAVAPFTLAGHDVAALAAALVESERERKHYLHAINGIVEVDLAEREMTPPPAATIAPSIEDAEVIPDA